MKKVLFDFEGNDLKFLMTYFKKFEVDEGALSIGDNNDLLAGMQGDIQSNTLNNLIKFKYKNTEIHVYTKPQKITEDFDKIYYFSKYVRRGDSKRVNKNKNTKEYEHILVNVGERTSVTGEMYEELNGHKLISGANCEMDGVFYDYRFNLIYFYYYFGFNYLRYKYREVKKQSVLGLYWHPYYKKERDVQVEFMKKASNFPIDFYSSENELSTYECLRTITRDNWEKNHISSWTDYETSMVGYVFETLHHSTEFESKHRLEYIGEKTLKPLLFSFLKMPFILDCNPYSFIDLNKDGYWFLNSEFFEGNVRKDNFTTLKEKLSHSIENSIHYLQDMYYTHMGDIDKMNGLLYEEYKDKIDNNHKKIINEVYNPTAGEELLKFILK